MIRTSNELLNGSVGQAMSHLARPFKTNHADPSGGLPNSGALVWLPAGKGKIKLLLLGTTEEFW